MLSNRLRVSVLLTVLALAFASVAHASPIVFNPGPNTSPDIRSDLDNISYNAVSGLLTMTGEAQLLRLPAAQGVTSGTGTFTLTAHVTNSGCGAGVIGCLTGALGTNTLKITGGVPTHSPVIAPGATLFMGNLTAFDFTPYNAAANSFAIFRFLANVTADPQNLGFGSLAGVLVPTNDVTALNFLSNFSNGSSGGTDVFGNQTLASVPEPTSLLLLATGGVILLRKRLFRKRSAAS